MATPLENVDTDLAHWRTVWLTAVMAENHAAETAAMTRLNTLLDKRLDLAAARCSQR